MQTLKLLAAFLAAHPGLVYALVTYLAANVSNALLDVSKRDEGGLVSLLRRALDAVAFVTQRGAANRWSLPFWGMSLVREVIERISAPPAPPEPIEPAPAPAPRDDSAAGFVSLQVLAALGSAFVIYLAAALSTCRMPDPDGCTPNETRCLDGRPWVCSGTRRWVATPTDTACGERDPQAPAAVCCLARAPWGDTVHTCVASPAYCIEGDAGVLNVDGGAL